MYVVAIFITPITLLSFVVMFLFYYDMVWCF